MSGNTLSASSIPSVQVVVDGVPRFHVPGNADEPGWAEAATAEAEGGVEAEIRAFLDAQLETGDVLLDLSPGFGFVALSATTAPGGMPTVFVAGLPAERLQRLQDVAADAGGWLETVDVTDATALIAALDSRLEPEGRVFVHVSTANVPWICRTLQPLIETGRVLAICVSDASDSPDWTAAADALADNGMTPCQVVEHEGAAIIVPVVGSPSAPVIALPNALTEHPTPESGAMEAVTAAAAAMDTAVMHDTADDPIVEDVSGEEFIFPTLPVTQPLMVSERWVAARDGISLIAPYSRTGYGVVGAHLLRTLQARDMPVAFFPLGPVDRTLIENPQMGQGLQLQGAFRPDVPSVRLSQQFDLAMHVGRGRHVAYTIFERDQFTASEAHHLRQQDALLVCSEWARQVCLDNGIVDRPIHVVPLGVDRTVFHAEVRPATSWSETVFMQIGKLETRKGQLELLRAFEAAFTPRDAVRLVLSCGNPFVSRADMEAMLMPFRQSPMAARITILTNELPTLHDVAALMAGADCGVFPSRAEGWNLEALEMLSMGKPVIASSCTAHTEFLNRDNARLITIDGFEQATSNGTALAGRWAAWGARQHEQLVTHLRGVHERKQQGAMPRNDSGIRTAQRYSWQHAADELVRALDAIV
ncbi:MAG: glycosyltransferase family 4 protein [Gemmatimonadaceae bacterium]|nr:glycosyltransferase family 4 protein [Gemmatimonadaceae bacterium]